MNEKVTCADCKHFNPENNVCAVLENTVRPGYGCYEGEPRKMTNGDKIRQMSDEELADIWVWRLRCGYCPLETKCLPGTDINQCRKSIMHWLKHEVKHG